MIDQFVTFSESMGENPAATFAVLWAIASCWAGFLLFHCDSRTPR